MKKEEKIDFSKDPIMVEVGFKFASSINANKDFFSTVIEDMRNSINISDGITVPEIRVTDNLEMQPAGYRLIIFGKQISDIDLNPHLTNSKDFILNLIRSLGAEIKRNCFYFKENFIVSKKEIEELKHEQSREAYQQLYRYYSNIELDKKQAFHWLKKMSYYGVPDDLRKLGECYFRGEGCDKDERQNRKLFDLWHSDSSSKWRF